MGNAVSEQQNTKRIYLREISSGDYGLEAYRRKQLGYERIRPEDLDIHGDPFADSEEADHPETIAPWRVGPGDPQLLTQTVQVHFRHIAPGKQSGRHGHQNEAVFYILSGQGYDIDDEQRYEYSAGDTLLVHTDSVHQHFNASDTEWTRILVFKAKSLWMYLGLLEQGKTKSQDDADFDAPQAWDDLWTPGVKDLKKVVKKDEGSWVDDQRIGHIRRILDLGDDARQFALDMVEQLVAPGEASVQHRHMADEIVYVLEGTGVSVQRDVRSQIDTRYHARVSKHSREWEIKAGDVVYVPQNCIHRFEASGGQPLRFLSAQNRMFRHLGYDNIVVC